MKITPIAFDSLGVRSMATYVKTYDLTLIIDPSAALAPRRYGLPPHEVEIRRLHELSNKIYELGKEADVIIITHYHYDHHDPGRLIPVDMYKNKTVLIKDWNQYINISQKIRAHRFLSRIKNYVSKILIADNKEFYINKTNLKFSIPLPHGNSSKLGYVINVCICEKRDEVMLYTSDVEGVPLKTHLDFIIRNKPETLILDGPSTYLEGYKVASKDINTSIKNIAFLIRKVKPKYLILEHHILRDINYHERIKEVFRVGKEEKVKVITAAEYLGIRNMLLEAYRFKLYGRGYSRIGNKDSRL